MSQTVVVRLSWVTYIGPVMRLVFFVIASRFYFSSLGGVRQWVADSMPTASEGMSSIVVLLPALILLYGVFRAIWSIWLNKTVILKIEPDGVEYRSGILPWKRVEQYWRYHQIFKTMYSNKPEFLGWLLRFGDLIIVGREGSTHEYRIQGLHDPRRVQMLIAGRLEKQTRAL